jgi:hypothetical protein
MLSLGTFISFLVLLLYRTRIKESGGLTKDELLATYTRTSSEYKVLLIFVIVLSLILQQVRLINLNQFITGFGFGAISGLVVIIIAVKAIMPYLLLGKKTK